MFEFVDESLLDPLEIAPDEEVNVDGPTTSGFLGVFGFPNGSPIVFYGVTLAVIVTIIFTLTIGEQ